VYAVADVLEAGGSVLTQEGFVAVVTGGGEPWRRLFAAKDGRVLVTAADGHLLGAFQMSDGARRAMLGEAIANAVADGAELQSREDFTAVIVNSQGMSLPANLINLALTVLTMGAWAFVWFAQALLAGGRMPIKIVVNEYGVIERDKDSKKLLVISDGDRAFGRGLLWLLASSGRGSSGGGPSSTSSSSGPGPDGTGY